MVQTGVLVVHLAVWRAQKPTLGQQLLRLHRRLHATSPRGNSLHGGVALALLARNLSQQTSIQELPPGWHVDGLGWRRSATGWNLEADDAVCTAKALLWTGALAHKQVDAKRTHERRADRQWEYYRRLLPATACGLSGPPP